MEILRSKAELADSPGEDRTPDHLFTKQVLPRFLFLS